MSRILSTTGFGFSFDGTTITAVSGPATLALSFAQDAPTINYTQIFFPEPGLLPDVDIGGDEPLLVAINNLLFGDEIDASIGRVVWSGGTTDVLALWVSDEEQYIFRLGGAPLPTPANATEAQAFLASIVQPVGLPPVGSGFEPGIAIPLSALDGWTSTDASDSTSYAVSALGFTPGAGEFDPPQDVQSSTITFVIDGDTAPNLFYQALGLEEEAGPSGAAATIARPGFSEQPFTILVDGQPIQSLAGEYQVFFARIVTTDGTTHDVMNLEFSDTGRQFLVSLGGDPLPEATQSAAAAFFGSIDSVDPIPTGFGAAGEDIPLSGLPGVTISDFGPPPAEGTGDPAVVQLNGFRIDEDDDEELLGFDTVQLTLALPADNATFSYTLIPNPSGDGFDTVDISGAEPYALLIDGVLPSEEFVIGIERITVDGVSYDLMLLRVGDSNSTYVFQIDGATPLPFTNLAAVADFVEKADLEGAFGPIPAGSPFAPGSDFTFFDSPYATISTDPTAIFGGDTFDARPNFGIGAGAGTEGSLTVVNGEVVTFDAESVGPFLQIGRGLDAFGAITVAGPGSKLEIESGGASNDGVSANIGREGGVGVLRVLDGGRFEISDPIGTSGGTGNGREFFSAGRGADGDGAVEVRGGSIAITGTGANASFGRDGGSGSGMVENGSFRVESTTQDLANLQIGRDGGSGELELLEDGRVLVQAGDGGNARVDIGLRSGGTEAPGGFVDINGGQDAGLIVMGGANSPYVAINVGRGETGETVQTGGGMVLVNGGFFGALNRGLRLDDNLDPVGETTRGGEAEIFIGRNAGAAGKGIVRLFNGAEIFASGTDAGRITIGAGAGAEGELSLSGGSELRAFSQEGDAGIEIGGWNGGRGLMDLRGGSEAEINGANGAYLDVGHGTGSFGYLLVREGSEILLRGGEEFTSFQIGVRGGEGIAALQSGAEVRFDGVDRFLAVGRADGDTSGDTDGTLLLTGAGTRLWAAYNTVVGEGQATGTMQIAAGAAAILGRTDANTNVSFVVGDGSGSDGLLEVFDGRLSLQGANGGFESYSAFGLNGGAGRAEITGARETDAFAAHGFIQIGGGSSRFSTVDIGRGAGSLGEVMVQGAFFGTQNDGTTFSTEAPFGPVDLPGDGGRALLRLGVEGGEGSLIAGPASEIFVISGAQSGLALDDPNIGGAALVVGGDVTGGGGQGTLHATDSFIEIRSGEMDETADFGAPSMIGGAFAGINVGRGAGGVGTVTLDGGTLAVAETGGVGFVSLGRDGGNGTLSLFGEPDTPMSETSLEVLAGTEANLDVGRGAGSTGLLRAEGNSAVVFTSIEHQTHNIGWLGGNGTLNLSGGAIFEGTTTGEGFTNFMFVGTEGGTGTVLLDEASLYLRAEDGNAGLRIGMRLTGTENAAGNGALRLENGSLLEIDAADLGNLWIGGGTGSLGQAEVLSGSTIAMGPDGVNSVLVGAVHEQGDMAGGQGSLTIRGEGSQLRDAQILVVGFNNGEGLVEVREGGRIDLFGNEDRPDVVLGVGVAASETTGNPGFGQINIDGEGSVLSLFGSEANAGVGGGAASAGRIVISAGGELEIRGDGSPDSSGTLDIGDAGGRGAVLVDGEGSLVTVADSGALGGMIEIATAGAGSTGILYISGGAEVFTGTIEVGGAESASGALIVASGGRANAADALNVGASGVIGGTGTLAGTVTINGGALGAGDTYDTEAEEFGYGQGTLVIDGSLIQTGGEAYFDFGGVGGDDLLSVTGELSFSGTEFTLVYNGVAPTAGYSVKLAQATSGITLGEYTLAATAFDGLEGAAPMLELRNNDTELWFVTAADLPPPTYTLSGAIGLREIGAPNLSGTEVRFTTSEGTIFNATTGEDGSFSFTLDEGTSGTLELVRDYNAPPAGTDKALGIQDVLSLFRVVVESPSVNPQSDDFIAANFNGDSIVNIQDVLSLFRHVVGAGTRAPEYLFVDADAIPAASLGAVPTIDNTFTIDAITSDTNLAFLGILTGDMQSQV